MRMLASLALLVVHATGVALALWTLWVVSVQRLLLVIVFPGLSSSLALVWVWTIVVVLGLTAALSGAQLVGSLLRLVRRRAEPRAGLRLRIFLYLALGCISLDVFVFSSPVAILGPFRIQFPVFAEIFATFVFGAYEVWSLRIARRDPRVPGRALRLLDVACMNVAVALVIAELGLRVLAAFVPIPILVTDASSSKIRRNAERSLPGTLRFGFPINQGGHFDSEFVPRAERQGSAVVSIGDSFSYGTVPHAYHFTSVVERERPGIEVYNMGFPGTGPRDYLELLAGTALTLEPDLVLIQIFVGNDFGAGASWSDPPRWYDADHYLLGIVWHRLQILRRAELKNWADAGEVIAQDEATLEARFPWLLDPMLEEQHLSQDAYFGLATRNAREIGSDEPAVDALFFGALEGLVSTAYAHELPLAFVLIPDEFQVEDALWREIVAASDVPLERDRAQRVTVDWLERRGIPVLDLLPILREVAPLADGNRHVYHFRDPHFNARGNEAAGLAMARFIDDCLQGANRRAPLPIQIAFEAGRSRPRLIRGWHESDGTHAWSDGLESVLVAPLRDDEDVRMSIDWLPFPDAEQPEQRVAIFVNETALTEIALQPGLNTTSVVIPAKLLRYRANRIRFRYSHTSRPADVIRDSEDEREIAVAWYSIRFERATDAADATDR
jgi:hypothetical protein